ncbi:MAG: hypothetical protein GWN99_18360 [Gemmatimonadetes bacterium]|nr:hypothetical protein [Gemmatimonadota bacterium]NIS03000.1 hypothetical protein [Gemmatimonadota bacterium]NIT68717.1 hypothetical protein [Gemmatimonadota bacterium]NIV25399.1 hypothetical protein [Gemmatimonadota bacterium]NIW38770.1 hypothetical protein [Gemmatimonadota bacterium]
MLLTLAAAGYQRMTGPSYPERGSFSVAGSQYEFELVRAATTAEGAEVRLPAADGLTGRVLHRRYRTDDEFVSVPLERRVGQLVAALPTQPPAGKLEYFVILDTPNGTRLIPRSGGSVVVRFKDPVPPHFLVPHIAFMFTAMLIGVRAGLGALFAPARMRRLAWTSLAVITVGGLVLGPIAQYYAFGAFWTGWPFDSDLTDNKVLLMWLVWVAACLVIALRPSRRHERVPRAAVTLAALVMLGVYVIPHSARGTELDYELYESGVPASEALKSGRDR